MKKNIIISLYSKVISLIKICDWKFQAYRFRSKMAPITFDELHLKNSLILAPHSDDEWIGCSSIIENIENVLVLDMDMSGNDSEATHVLRKEEIKKTVSLYHKNYYLASDNKIDELANLIKKNRFDSIFVPFFVDWHEEHIGVMNILKEALQDYKCKIITYQVSCPIPYLAINYAIPFDKKMSKNKWMHFKKNYETQKEFPWRRFFLIERAQGRITSTYAANVYSVYESAMWKKMFFLVPTKEERIMLKNKIHNIEENAELVNCIYCKKMEENRYE